MNKKLFHATLVILMTLVATSCEKATYLKANKNSVSFTISGGTDTVQLSSDATDFSVENAPDWVEASIKDSTMTVNVAKNSTGAKRNGVIVVTVGGLERGIDVVQYFEATHLSVKERNVSFNKEGGTKVVDVDCDGKVEVEAPDFVNVSYVNGKLNIKAAPNDGSTQKGAVKLSSGKFTAEVAIAQAGKECSRCGGSGKIKCPKCKGEGSYWTTYYGEDCIWGCERCGGDGYGGPHGWCRSGSGRITCPDCHGTGR